MDYKPDQIDHPRVGGGSRPICLIDEHEAAEILGLKVATLRRWRWAGRGPAFRKIGASVRYHPEDLTAFAEAARRQSTSDPGPEAA
jgi:hypothetical protein